VTRNFKSPETAGAATDFTESAYRGILAAAKRSYGFEPFGTDCKTPHLLWRHDVDVSVQRAARLAEIEAEEGVLATYFFWFHSPFYNLLERNVVDAARRALNAGHRLGLHFDSGFYGVMTSPDEFATRVAHEASLLGELLERSVEAVSCHNPGAVNDDLAFDADHMAGLVNAYGRGIRERYGYLSDSNGHWRFRRMLDVLTDAHDERLQVLTHPEWWQAEVMPPRQRIVRCVEGRAARTLRDYDDALVAMGRLNLT
jgi:hypothetical protein